jgi:hypothetical protein
MADTNYGKILNTISEKKTFVRQEEKRNEVISMESIALP